MVKKVKENQISAPSATGPQNGLQAKSKRQGLKATAATAPDVPDALIRKPTAKQLVGGSSWTGKLPTALLHEFCQKQGWLKPDYNLSNRSGSYVVSAAILAKKNPKNSEIENVNLRPTKEELEILPAKDVAVEARNIAATWCLHRVGHKLNFSMQMPPDHRQIWTKLELVRKEDFKNKKEFLYDLDPFKAAKDHAVEVVKWEKENTKKAEDQAHTSKTPGKGNHVASWKNFPQIQMSREMRQQIETAIRTLHVGTSRAASISERPQIVQNLVSLGFRKLHAEEACEYSHSTDKALEFLLLFTPEDDLPHQFLPPSYSTGVSGSTHDTESLQIDYAAKRVHEAGYPIDLCRQIMKRVSNEDLACEILQAELLQQDIPKEAASCDHTEFAEEIASLESTYSDSFESRKNSSKISLALPTHRDYRLHLSPPASGPYPQRLPSFYISHTKPLPSYVRLAIISEAGQYAKTLIGEPMLFLLLEFIDEHLLRIIANPGKLLDLSGITIGNNSLQDRISSTRQEASKKRRRRHIDWTCDSSYSKALKEARDAILRDPVHGKKIEARERLPAFKQQQRIVDILKTDQCLVISGETGSGKSTQVVQYVLDSMIDAGLGAQCKIICTQPRRISALGLADRVGDERSNSKEVGYAIRGDSKQGPNTKISFVTTGVLLRRLTVNGDAGLDEVTHVFVDEVHERSIDSDFLLIALRDLISRRKDLKIILMSATVEAELFCSYLGGAKHLHIEGRTFPVQDYYLEDMRFLDYGGVQREKSKNGVDYDLIASIVEHVDQDLGTSNLGGILIFLPGTMEISRALNEIDRRSRGRWLTLPLHASLPAVQQKKVFQRSPTRRKIIAATNVAETSITIDDIVAVIDTGRVKQMIYDASTGITKFEETWCSKAACKQRRGRAGRVQAGVCYKTFTRTLENAKMSENTVPEIVRTPLEQVLLGALAMTSSSPEQNGSTGGRGQAFLKKAVTVPDQRSMDNAVALLKQVGATDEQENLTPLGRLMSVLPTDLKIAKLLILSSIFGVVERALTIAACLSTKSPFASGPDSGEVKARFAGLDGDVFGTVRAYEAWSQLSTYRDRRAWCETNLISDITMQDIKSTSSQLLDSLREARLVRSSSTTQDSQPSETGDEELLKSIISAALQPNLARIQRPPKTYSSTSSGALERDPESRQIKFFTEQGRVFIHPSSPVFSQSEFRKAEFLSFFEVTETSKLFVRGITPIGVYGHLLLSGSFTLDPLGRGILVNNWIRLAAWPKIAVFVELMRGFIAELMARKVDEPEYEGNPEILGVMKRLISRHGQ